jgi:hypothetical protein
MKWQSLFTDLSGKSWRFSLIVRAIVSGIIVLIWKLSGGKITSDYPAIFFLVIFVNILLSGRKRYRPTPVNPAWKGICESCGYDMRATLDRCPECGKTPTVPANRADIADYKKSFRKLTTQRLESLVAPDTVLPLEVQAAARELLVERRREVDSDQASGARDQSVE